MAKMKKLENKLTAEIASRKDELVLYGDIIPNPDKVLLTRGRGRNLEIYEDLETDAHVRTVISKRKRAVTSREWFVNEADGSEEATKSAELVRKCLNLINLDRLTEDLLDAVLKGYSVAEIMWGYDENEKIIRPLEIRSRKPQRFIFKQAENDCELRLLTLDSPIDGIEVPERKFIVFTYDRRFDNPYGFGLGNSLFWPVLFKRKGITFWLTFCDKFGSPTSVGKYPASASDSERATLREALEAIANDYGIIVPEGMEVSLLEASKASTDTYEKLARFMDEQISEIVLGETGSTNQSNGGGSRARDQVGNEIRLETAKADADMLCQVLNDSLVRWIVELNMPGAPLPKLWRDFEEGEDLKEKAGRDNILAGMGVKFTKEYFKENYNLRDEDFELSEDNGKSKVTLPDVKEFAGENAVEIATDTLEAQELERQMSGILEPVIKLVKTGKSYEEIMEHLVETYDFMNSDALQDMLDRAFFLTNAWSRLNAK